MTQTSPPPMAPDQDHMADEPPRRRRKLSAIMMADVQGFSRLMGADEDTTVDLIQSFHERVRALVTQFEGRVVDTAGDSVFSEFDSVVNAVRCARRIQEDQAAVNRERGDGRHIFTRIGVHLGDVIVEDYNVYGDGVNIAARLEPLAAPGGICLSEAVYQQIRNKLDIPLEDLGIRELKNIQYPIHLYRVPPPQLINGDPGSTTGATAPPPEAPPAGAEGAPPGDTAANLGKEAARALKREAKEAVRAIGDEARKVAREARRAHRDARHAERHGSSEAPPAGPGGQEIGRSAAELGQELGKAGQELGQAAAELGQEVGKAAGEFGQRVAKTVPESVDTALKSASAAAEQALRSALGQREGEPPAPPPPAEPPHEKVDRALASWMDDLRAAGTLIPMIVGIFLLLSPVFLFPTGGVFPTGGAILLAVCLGGVWARRTGRSRNFLLALGLGIASGAVWTNWSGVTNALFILAGLIVAATGTARRRKHRKRRRGRHRHDGD